MENRNNILQELESIAPAVASIPFENTYAVPDQYFYRLSEEILEKIQIPVFLSDNKQHPFTVPTGYFDHLADKINARIRQECLNTKFQSDDLNLIGNQNIMSVPDGFFEGLSSEIMASIRHKEALKQELEAIAPVLNSISKANPYKTPEGYFDAVVPVVAVPKKATILKMAVVRKWVAYAAAAVITGILATGGIRYMLNSPVNQIDIQSEVAKQEDEAILQYLEKQSDINYVIMETGSENAPAENGFFESMSDEEIKDYLNKHDQGGQKNSENS